MLVVLNATAVRSVDALPALPTREPTATDVPPPQSLQITLSHSDSGDVVVSAAPVAEGPPSSVGETPTPVLVAVDVADNDAGDRVVTVSQPDDTPQDELVEPELTATPFLVVTVTRPTVRPTLPPQVTVVIVATPEPHPNRVRRTSQTRRRPPRMRLLCRTCPRRHRLPAGLRWVTWSRRLNPRIRRRRLAQERRPQACRELPQPEPRLRQERQRHRQQNQRTPQERDHPSYLRPRVCRRLLRRRPCHQRQQQCQCPQQRSQ